METKKPDVVIPSNIIPPPQEHEVSAAWILARHYEQTVEFLASIDDYKRKTPDFVMGGVMWEVKSPEGKSRQNVERQLRRALRQSRNIIFDGRRSAVPDDILKNKLKHEITIQRSVRKLVFISKDKKVLEIVWKK